MPRRSSRHCLGIFRLGTVPDRGAERRENGGARVIELSGFSMHHELLYWRQRLLDAVDKAIVITLLTLIYLSVLVALLGGR